MTPSIPDLIKRLEKLEGPDREIDGLIALTQGWTYQKMKGDRRPYFRKPGVTDYFHRSECPAYTGSVDAALTLVPDGLNYVLLSLQDYAEASVGGGHTEYLIKSGEHVIPAIALCIAILRARGAQDEGEN